MTNFKLQTLDSEAEALRELIRFLIRKTQISQFFYREQTAIAATPSFRSFDRFAASGPPLNLVQCGIASFKPFLILKLFKLSLRTWVHSDSRCF